MSVIQLKSAVAMFMLLLYHIYSPMATRALQHCKDNNLEIANFLLVSYVCMYECACTVTT